LAIEVKEDALKVGFVEDLLVFGSAEEESVAANGIDEARDAFSVMV
jgi:hypothetical protein